MTQTGVRKHPALLRTLQAQNGPTYFRFFYFFFTPHLEFEMLHFPHITFILLQNFHKNVNIKEEKNHLIIIIESRSD